MALLHVILPIAFVWCTFSAPTISHGHVRASTQLLLGCTTTRPPGGAYMTLPSSPTWSTSSEALASLGSARPQLVSRVLFSLRQSSPTSLHLILASSRPSTHRFKHPSKPLLLRMPNIIVYNGPPMCSSSMKSVVLPQSPSFPSATCPSLRPLRPSRVPSQMSRPLACLVELLESRPALTPLANPTSRRPSKNCSASMAAVHMLHHPHHHHAEDTCN